MTCIGIIAGMTIGNMLYHGLGHGDWIKAFAISGISALLVSVLWLCTGYPK